MAVSPRSSKFGLNIATSGSWGTGTGVATAMGAGDGHWVTDDIGDSISMQMDLDTSAGQSFIGSIQTANFNPSELKIPTFLHYNDAWQNVLFALACGTGGTAPSVIGATTAYNNTFEPATNKTGLYATIVRDKVQFISETPAAKCTGFELSFGDNGRGEIVWNFIGNKGVVDSAINTSTQVSAMTFPTQGLRAFFKQATFRVNAASGGALGASDAVKVVDVKIMFEQPLDALHVAGQDVIIEPEDNDYPNITIELEFARFDSASDNYAGYHRDKTELKADFTFVGPTLATTTYGLLFQFPHLVVTEAPVEFKAGAENVRPKATLKGFLAASAPTGMTGITRPFRITTTGVSTTNPFA
jgi:hypothetical protein